MQNQLQHRENGERDTTGTVNPSVDCRNRIPIISFDLIHGHTITERNIVVVIAPFISIGDETRVNESGTRDRMPR